jgi:hypothetical protein
MEVDVLIQKHKDTITALEIFVETSHADVEMKQHALDLIEVEKEAIKALTKD